jgi:hypothetical protein
MEENRAKGYGYPELQFFRNNVAARSLKKQ